MENHYIVILVDTVDSMERVTVCKNEDELAELLLHLDKDKFTVMRIDCVGKPDEIQSFLKRDDTLELGGRKDVN